MTYRRPDHPDTLTGDALTARTQGDALHLAEVAHDAGPDALQALLALWGETHTRRVAIALAAAIDPNAKARNLWGWLGGPKLRTTRTVPETDLWRAVRPPREDICAERRPVDHSDAARERMAERGRARAAEINTRRRQRRTA